MNNKEPQPENIRKMLESVKKGRLKPQEAISTFPRLFHCPVRPRRKKGAYQMRTLEGKWIGVEYESKKERLF